MLLTWRDASKRYGRIIRDWITPGGETGCNVLSVCCWLGIQEFGQWASSGLSPVVSTSCPLNNYASVLMCWVHIPMRDGLEFEPNPLTIDLSCS